MVNGNKYTMDGSQTWTNGQEIEKFGLYLQYSQNVIATTSNSQDHSTLQGKFTKLIGAKVLQHYTLFINVPWDAKHFNLITQKYSIN